MSTVNSSPYVVSLLITTEQEHAITMLFQQRGWAYFKRDARPAYKDELELFYKCHGADSVHRTFQNMPHTTYSDLQSTSMYGTFHNLLQSPLTMVPSNRTSVSWQGSGASVCHSVDSQVYQNLPVNFSLASGEGPSASSEPVNEFKRHVQKKESGANDVTMETQMETPVMCPSVVDSSPGSTDKRDTDNSSSILPQNTVSQHFSNSSIIVQTHQEVQSRSVECGSNQPVVQSNTDSDLSTSRNDTANKNIDAGPINMGLSTDSPKEDIYISSKNHGNHQLHKSIVDGESCSKNRTFSSGHRIDHTRKETLPQTEPECRNQEQVGLKKLERLVHASIDKKAISAAAVVEMIQSIVGNKKESVMNAIDSCLQNFFEQSKIDESKKEKVENLVESNTTYSSVHESTVVKENTQDKKRCELLSNMSSNEEQKGHKISINSRAKRRIRTAEPKLKMGRKQRMRGKKKHRLKEEIKFEGGQENMLCSEDTNDVGSIGLEYLNNDNDCTENHTNNSSTLNDYKNDHNEVKVEIESNDVQNTKIDSEKDSSKRNHIRNKRKRSSMKSPVRVKATVSETTAAKTAKAVADNVSLWTREARYGINRNLRLHSYHRKCRAVPVDLDDNMFSAQENGYYCSDCSFIFPKRNKLLVHKKLKIGDRCVPDCIYCDAEENKNVFQCKKCPKVFETKELLDRHIETHNTTLYSCKICPESFYTAPDLNFHLSQAHGEELKQTFLCDLCGSKFSEKKILNAHRKYVHTENRPEVCSFCGRGFKTKSQLKNHLVTHKSVDDLQLSCEICGKMFARAATLRDHVRRHMKDFTFFCDVCHKGFYKKFALEEHMRSHTGDKPYACKYCGFKCALSCNLAKHLRVHEKAKPFSYTTI